MEKFKVTVYVTGLKRKERKIKRHFFNAGYVDYNPNMTEAELNEIKDKAMGLIETNMKNFTNVSVSLDQVKIDGYVETWMPFSDKNITLKVA
jgi:hypothetical protein